MSERLFTASVLAIIFSLLSLLCSLINVVLIHVMQQWNGFLAILYSMTFCQILYDATFYMSSDTSINPTAVAVWSFCQAFGGLSVTFWTNMLAATLLHVVSKRTRVNILQSFWTLSVIVYFPSFVIALIHITCTLTDQHYCEYVLTWIYYWARLISIAFNFVVFGYLSQFTKRVPASGRSDSRSLGEVSVIALCRRMMYYPLIQCISRIFNAVYEALYGFSPYDGDPSSSIAARRQFILQCLACITQPSAGIGFLVVFLIFQPRAKEHLWALMTHCSTQIVGKPQLAMDTFEPSPSALQENLSSLAQRETDAAPQSSFQVSFGTDVVESKEKLSVMDENYLMEIIHRESMMNRASRKTLENPLL
jgi:hypothetical protein